MKNVEILLNCVLFGTGPNSATYENRVEDPVLGHYAIAEMAKATEKSKKLQRPLTCVLYQIYMPSF